MGNNLCATWQRGGGGRGADGGGGGKFRGGSSWLATKDTPLIRLWAEIFEVREENDASVWRRISEEVVPVSVSCVRSGPEQGLLQIVAYDRFVEKIFDVLVTQPGTQFVRSSECFVHWRDTNSGREWGLNFVKSSDARAFQDCCMGHVTQNYGTVRMAVAPAAEPVVYQKKLQVATNVPPVESAYGYSVPRNATLTTMLPQQQSATVAERAASIPLTTSLVDANSYYSSPTKRRNVVDERCSNHCSQNARPMQVRQVVSVYLDNRCRCGLHCLPADRVSDPTGSHSLPYVARGPPGRGNQQDIYGTMNMALVGKMRHTCQSKCCHVEKVDFDNSINQSIDLATKESRRTLVEGRRSLALEWKGEGQRERSEELHRKMCASCRETVRNSFCRCSQGSKKSSDFRILSYNSREIELRKQGGYAGQAKNQCELVDEGSRVLSSAGAFRPPSALERPPTASVEVDASEYTLAVATATSVSCSEDKAPVSSYEAVLDADKVRIKEIIPDLYKRDVAAAAADDARTEEAQMLGEDSRYLKQADRAVASKWSFQTTAPISEGVHLLPDTAVVEATAVGFSVHMEIPDGISKPGENLLLDSREIRTVNDDASSGVRTSDQAVGPNNATGMVEATCPTGTPSTVGSLGQRRDSISWPETSEVRRLMTSDISGSEGGSDPEDGYDCSSLHTMPSQASFASKSTVVRRAGWLSVKNWLVHRKRKIELAPKRTWKRYWVCLKGNILHFFVTDEGVGPSDDAIPRHKLVIEGALVQPAPEHPKKENAFSLSTAFGDAYLFQASNQTDLDTWIRAIHSACAASLARQHGKANTLRLLNDEVHRLDTNIELDIKMRKMALMHMASVSDPRSRQAIEKQLNQWEQNLEKLYIEHYRLRCYAASLQGAELPNSKSVLASVSKNTKVFLSRIGVFSVNAFHAFVYARSFSSAAAANHLTPSALKAEMLNPTIGQRTQSSRMLGLIPGQKSQFATDMQNSDPPLAILPEQTAKTLLRVKLPNSQMETSVQVTSTSTVQDVIDAVCNKTRLNTADHFLRLNLPCASGIKMPERNTILFSEDYESVELCQKVIYQVELICVNGGYFGFQVEAELAEDAEEEDELRLFVSDVISGGVADVKGLFVGDEILVINGKAVSELDMVYVENLLLESRAVSLTLRSCLIDRNQMLNNRKTSNSSEIEKLMCPPPPSQTPITDQNIGQLIVPAPSFGDSREIPDLLRTRSRTSENNRLASERIDDLLKGVNQVMYLCRRQYSIRSSDLPDNGNCIAACQPMQPLSNAQHICKVVMELIDTERSYVRDLTCLIERYLEPLKEETYITSDDVEQLFGNIQQIVQFQRLFLQSLEEAVQSDTNFNKYNDKHQPVDEGLVRVLLQIGNSFIYYAHHFKLYSSFCASHSKAQKMILCDDNVALREFLHARNPKQQHSSALESYLIKPIQRILKYPLLLKQLLELTDLHSNEHLRLKGALEAMELVAEHINEMQKIYEEYGNEFEELIRIEKQERHSHKNINLSVGDLQMYGTVNWINVTDELGKLKKTCDLLTLIFIFKSAVVILAQDRLKMKKRAKSFGVPSESSRFKTVIPISELKVQRHVGDPTEGRGIWEIIHCRSEKEGRPKKSYQFVSSTKACNDFVRTILRTLQEKSDTARRMSAMNMSSRLAPSPRYCGRHQPHLYSAQDPESQHHSAAKTMGNNQGNIGTPVVQPSTRSWSESNYNAMTQYYHSNHYGNEITMPPPRASRSSSMPPVVENYNSLSLPSVRQYDVASAMNVYQQDKRTSKLARNVARHHSNEFASRQVKRSDHSPAL